MAELKGKELWDAAEKLIAEHEKKLAERLQIFFEKHKPYESIEAILIERFHYTQEQIDHYQFRSDRNDHKDRREYEAMVQRFLNTEF